MGYDLLTRRPATPAHVRSPTLGLLRRWRAQLEHALRGRGGRPDRRANVWNAWAVAELECALALRAWQLAPLLERRLQYAAYRRALERETLLAGKLSVACDRARVSDGN